MSMSDVNDGMIGGMARLLRILAVALGLVVLGAAPAAADAAGPGDFLSTITEISPATPGVAAEIQGGDAFLVLTVDPGRTVIVEGYQGEPYLRFQPDGTVERNRLSTATYLNDDRRGQVALPPEVQAADADTEPVWEPVGSGGTYAWHDHRTHWMSDASPQVDRGQAVEGAYDPWRVPLVVDGARVEVRGTLTYASLVSPLPYVAVVVLSAALVLLWLRRGLRLPAAALVVVSALAVVVGRADYQATPDGGGNPLLWILAAVALVGAVGATAFGGSSVGVGLSLLSVASLFGWAIFRIQVLTKPVLPTDLPFALDRASVALALGVSAAVAYLAVTSGALTLPALEDDD